MTTTNNNAPRFVILAAIDASATADLVIAQAASSARATPGSEIHLLHVPDRFTTASITPRTFDLDEGPQYLAARARALHDKAGVTVIGHLLEKEPAKAILQVATSIDADLVIIGTRDRSAVERWVLGSTAQHVMQRAPCAVLVVRTKDHFAGHVPEIEPPCVECLREQRTSKGNTLWCARHREHHPRAHLHYEIPAGFGAGSSLIQS